MQGVTTLENKKKCPANPHWNTRFKSYAFADGIEKALCEEFRNAEALLMQSKMKNPYAF